MGRKSIKENKNIYQTCREKADLTRDKAGELMQFVSPDRIEKIESEKSIAHPDEVLAMSKCYKTPFMCNYYCSHECPIGEEYVPEIKESTLSQIVLEMLASLNNLSKEKDRLIEISVDGRVDDDEWEDFLRIRDQLAKISASSSALQLWLEKALAEGLMDANLMAYYEEKEKEKK